MNVRENTGKTSNRALGAVGGPVLSGGCDNIVFKEIAFLGEAKSFFEHRSTARNS